MTWKEALSDKKFKTEAAATLILLAGTLFCLTNFLNYVEGRTGAVLADPLLKIFNPVNLTWLIFGLIYISLVAGIINLSKYPRQLVLILQAYSLMVIVRMAAMFLLPLNPPQDMIILNDPFVQYFGTGKVLTKDLFFSGHTATLFLLFLFAKNKILKYVFLSCTIAVGLSVLLQHVHYSIDVFAAPFFAYTCYRLIMVIHKR